jgi:hypothetical protein
MRTHLLGILFFCAFVFISSISHASAVYRYQGENYENPYGIFDTTMSLTGTVELPAPLPPNLFDEVFPTSFKFNDGVNTITENNATSSAFGFATNNFGDIIGWQISLSIDEGGGPHSIGSEKLMLGFSEYAFPGIPPDFGAASTTKPGSWSVVPIPAALWLFGSGLLGLVGMARRKAV